MKKLMNAFNVLVLLLCVTACNNEEVKEFETPDMIVEIQDISSLEINATLPTFDECFSKVKEDTSIINMYSEFYTLLVGGSCEKEVHNLIYDYLASFEYEYSSYSISRLYSMTSSCDYAINICNKDLMNTYSIHFFVNTNEVIFLIDQIPFKMITERSVKDIFNELLEISKYKI